MHGGGEFLRDEAEALATPGDLVGQDEVPDDEASTGESGVIQDKARQDSQKLVDRAKAEIEQDITKARLSMRDDIVEISSLITEKVLREKLDAKEQEKLVDKFLKELERI